MCVINYRFTICFVIFCITFGSQTGTTALFFAAQGGYMDIANLLLEHGALVDSCSIVSEKTDNVRCLTDGIYYIVACLTKSRCLL